MKPLPPESFGISYQILFTVRVLHRYFLDFGAIAFDTNIPPADDLPAPLVNTRKKIELIRRVYDVGQFWDILPDDDTRQRLQNQRMLFKKQPDGFVVLVAIDQNARKESGALNPFLALSNGLKFVFAVYPTDSYFMLYTELAQQVIDDLTKGKEVTNALTQKKEIRPPRAFRLKNRNSTADPQENVLNTGETITAGDLEDRLVGQSVGNRLEPPLGFIEIEHAPDERTLLTADKQVHPAPNHLTFTLLLKNRTTRWRLKDDAPGLFKGEHQLVQNGLISVLSGTTKLPNPTPATTTFNADGHYYSTIF